ncbi:DEAD/DEAH box helicase [Mucilaginibacter aquaedulcis]|uniref:DEAD/DEAH box helicase n=1 Tax=Mucilaginibacter aquaedulcis TaxID=1187081 RepID=UPI0025B60A17|nr:DEAD/DEAH box helicase [Mucilaginibacter aquaedulcis]MDN3549617.1 DEAD/DEAH box helicase [Mucilaginibacter aquaedulcis]
MSFENLKLIEPLLKALKTEGYTTPTPIQAQAIPIILQHQDLLGCAQTGTGKTAAFALPILHLLHQDRIAHKEQKTIKALILTPTRELAIQIGESFTAYGKHTGLKNLVIFGGVSQNPQVDALRRGVDILIATPGRLLDLMNQRFIHLEHVKMLVLDEADRMLDMGFVNDVKKIIAKVPAKRQTLFFSATMPKEIQHLADTILTNPEKIEVTPVSSTADTIQQSLYYVDKNDKKSLLIHILKDKNIKTVLVFTRTKHGADKVVKDLTRVGITAEAIHGNKSQNARQRALTNFKNRTTRVLIATDIAARGIDIDELTHVINYEIPNIPETYVHRIGRTGRAGANGIAFSFCDEDEIEFLKDIHKLIAKEIPVEEAHPYPLSPVAVAAGMAAKKGTANANLRKSSPSGRGGGGNRRGGKPGGNRSGGGNRQGGKSKSGGNSGMSGASRSSGGNRH